MSFKYKVDLTNKKFDHLTVIKALCEDDESVIDASSWFCKCDCGEEILVKTADLVNNRKKGCSKCKNKRSRNPSWKGGKSISSGYIFLSGIDHPNAHEGAIAEHILVMSKIIGRPLIKGESVHHRNGIRHDNRPENLELRSCNHPYGQRAEDLYKWAKETVALYEPLIKNKQ